MLSGNFMFNTNRSSTTQLSQGDRPVGDTKASNIVFIDTRVENFTSLLPGLQPNTEAVVLDPNQDGINQITDFLKQRTGIVDSVQILSHGSAGSLQIGSTILNSNNLENYASQLKQWFSPLFSKAPDLMLYGCNVAAGIEGQNFIQRLSRLTGADVAASTDLTGSLTKGGNWILEAATGIIEAGQAFSQKVRDAYQSILAIFTVTNTNDSGAGSLRQAILDANATPGPDTINFNIAPGGPQTIRVGSITGLPLPYISDTVTINGETQPGFSDTGTPIIVLDGSSLPLVAGFDGLRFVQAPPTVFPAYGGSITSGSAANSVVQGLVISNFPGSGIKIGQADVYTGGSGPNGVTVQRNYIGTDITGTVAKPTSTWGDPNNTHALHVYNSSNNQLLNNLVSGNFTSTIVVRGTSTGNNISGNKVGTDISGKFALSNQRWGLYIITGGNTVTGNLVSANGLRDDGGAIPGVDIRVTGNVVTGNLVGTDISGSYTIANASNWSVSGSGHTIAGNKTSNSNVPAPYTAANTNLGLPSSLTPTLSPINPLLSAIPKDNTSNNGNLVKDIVGSSIGNYLPVPAPGIAITAVDNTNGIWQYSTDNGASWTNIPAQNPGASGPLLFPTPGPYNVWVNSGYPAPNNPSKPPYTTPTLLLAADDKNRLRFIPNPGFTGTANGVTYRAWNQRFGGNGALINTSGYSRTYATALQGNNMSVATDTTKIIVTAANTAPVLDTNLLPPSISGAVQTVASILGSSVTDPDVGAQQGIAITDVDSSNGTWQYSINGQHWIPIVGVSSTASLLLDAKARLRFVPNSGYSGGPGSMTIRAWDQTAGSNGSTMSTVSSGGTTAFSSGSFILMGTVPPPPPSPTVTPVIGGLPEEVVRLLRNPNAPATPAEVVVGSPVILTPNDKDNGSAVVPPPVVADDCPCEAVIKQQVANPVTGNLFGTDNDDVLGVLDTANTVYGFKGNDVIFAAYEAANLFGGEGDDLIFGGDGRNFLRGGKGKDVILGGNGQNIALGGGGSDLIVGGGGDDFLGGNGGDDEVYGGPGNDWLAGGKGNDKLFGGPGNDRLCGCEGDDVLRGGAGDDELNGGAGNDLLIGNLGSNTLTGGAGADRFRLMPGAFNLITDFETGTDVIELARGLRGSDLQIVQGVGGAVIGLNPGTVFQSDRPLAFLAGVDAASLTPSSFSVV